MDNYENFRSHSLSFDGIRALIEPGLDTNPKYGSERGAGVNQITVLRADFPQKCDWGMEGAALCCNYGVGENNREPGSAVR